MIAVYSENFKILKKGIEATVRWKALPCTGPKNHAGKQPSKVKLESQCNPNQSSSDWRRGTRNRYCSDSSGILVSLQKHRNILRMCFCFNPMCDTGLL